MYLSIRLFKNEKNININVFIHATLVIVFGLNIYLAYTSTSELKVYKTDY